MVHPFLIAALTVGAALALKPHSVGAQTFPSRPITMLVPYAPGGPLDLTARVIGDHVSKSLGQPTIIENVSGAGGNIASARLAKGDPTGHLLMIHQPALAANVALSPHLTFDTQKDLTGVALLNRSAMFLLASKSIRASTMAEVVAWMKQNDSKVRFAHAGVGSLSHLCAALFASSVNARAIMIPYRGGTPAIQDTIAGHTDLYCSSAQLAVEQIKAGTVVGIAVTSRERDPIAPEIPTTVELGYDKIEVSFWQGLFAPAGTPQAIVNRLHQTVRAALDDTTVQKRFADVGMTVFPPAESTPEATNQHLRAEIIKWAEVIRANKIEATSQ